MLLIFILASQFTSHFHHIVSLHTVPTVFVFLAKHDQATELCVLGENMPDVSISNIILYFL